jgi:hypothetical protein
MIHSTPRPNPSQLNDSGLLGFRVFESIKPSWIMRANNFFAVCSRATVCFGLKNTVAVVTSPDDSQTMWPVCESHSCSHSRSVVTLFLSNFMPAASYLSSISSSNCASPGNSTYREPSPVPIRRSRSRSNIPLRAKPACKSAYSVANP